MNLTQIGRRDIISGRRRMKNKILGTDAKMTYNMDTSTKRHANKKVIYEEE